MNCRKTLRQLALAAAVLAPVFVPSARALPVYFSINVAPPPLPIYTQPACPGEGFLWTPGYWAYGQEGYYWVPGTWVRPPRVGYLWTPAYWGYEGSGYNFHPGYWGPHIGFYGGINYGFGYGGYGYEGGYWRGNTFAYNRAVNNINPALVHNIYERPVPVLNGAYNHVSYNGGNGGVPYRASQQEAFAAQREQHIRPTSEQLQHQNFAAQDRQQFASYNHGRPAIAAAPYPGALRGSPGNQPYAGANRGGFANPSGPRAPFAPAYGARPSQPMPPAARGGFGNAPQGRGFAPRNIGPQSQAASGYRNGPSAPQYPGRQPQFQQRQPQFQQRQPQFQQRQPQFQSAPRVEGGQPGGVRHR